MADPTRKIGFHEIELGTTSWDPEPKDYELRTPQERFSIADSRLADGVDALVNITAVARSELEYDVGEIGLYTKVNEEDPVLFAILSEKDKLLTRKIANDTILVTFNVSMVGISPEKFDVKLGERLNLYAADWYTKTAQDIESIRKFMETMNARLLDLEGKHVI